MAFKCGFIWLRCKLKAIGYSEEKTNKPFNVSILERKLCLIKSDRHLKTIIPYSITVWKIDVSISYCCFDIQSTAF